MISEHHLEVTRTVRYYTIGNEAAREIWFVLHGYGQLARDFIANFEVIAGEERLIVAPEALSRFYLDREPARSHTQANVGATWMTREDREIEIEDYVRYLDRLHRTIVSDGALVTVLGFSQGTATASRWLAYGSARINHLILWCGGFAEDLDFVSGRKKFGSLAITCVLGERDEMVPEARLRDHLGRTGLDVPVFKFLGGHRLDDETLREIARGARKVW